MVHTFVEALLLVLIVVFIFLQSWRATVIPMLAVPVSLVGTFAAFVLLGFTINTLTLFAMVLAIGIVVDDAIVVVEAVEHHMAKGLSAHDATVKAMEEVSGPVMAIALILAAVFVPVSFLGGIAGVMYKQFAITVAVSTVLSALVALSLTPALCAMLLKPKRESRGVLARFFAAFNDRFERVTEGYGRGVQNLIRRAVLALLTLGIIIFVAFGLMNRVPGGFVPPEDQGFLIGSLQLPSAASLNRTAAVADKADAILAAAQSGGVTEAVNLTAPKAPGQAWLASEADLTWPVNLDQAAIDPHTGQVVRTLSWSEWPVLAQANRLLLFFHFGRTFGLLNQLALIVISLALTASVLWGYQMWWQRRPHHGPARWGRAPRRGAWRSAPRGRLLLGIAVVGAIGVVLPVFGVSLLVFLAVDAVWGRRRRPAPAETAG